MLYFSCALVYSRRKPKEIDAFHFFFNFIELRRVSLQILASTHLDDEEKTPYIDPISYSP